MYLFLLCLFLFSVYGGNYCLPHHLCSGPQSECDCLPFFSQCDETGDNYCQLTTPGIVVTICLTVCAIAFILLFCCCFFWCCRKSICCCYFCRRKKQDYSPVVQPYTQHIVL